MRKIIAISGAVGCCCLLATQLFLYSPPELKAEQTQAGKTDETARIEEEGTVAEREIRHLKQEMARLEKQVRQLMGTLEKGTGSSKDKTSRFEGATEPSGTARIEDVVTGKTFHAGADWTEKTDSLLPSAISSGVIVMWSGLLTDIPTGWALCDGTNGTPDLQNRFLYGAPAGHNPGATGGSINHSHTLTHTHTVDPPLYHTVATTSNFDRVAGTGATVALPAHTHTVDIMSFHSGPPSHPTSTASHLPPYFKLAFIMKL